ncbi:MAG: RNA-binding cell elongation regulator Jag/EloR [Actinomycetota bacterium]
MNGDDGLSSGPPDDAEGVSENVSEETPGTPDDDLLDDQADAAEDFIHGLLDVLDMDGEAEADITDDTIEVRVAGPDMGLLIGRHGSTLEALQELTRAAVQHRTSARARLVLDIEGYRERQRSMLERQARSAASQVRKTRRPVELDPMSSFERKVIHSSLSDFQGVRTASEGEEPERRVVIYPA